MSLKTVQRLEWGTVDPRASTFKKVDNAAGWPSGTARAIAEDDAPRPTPAQPSPASAGTPHEWSAAERARMRDMSMTEVQEVYETFVRRSEYLASVWMREVMRVKAEAEQAKAATQS